jgi:hypothetical protein
MVNEVCDSGFDSRPKTDSQTAKAGGCIPNLSILMIRTCAMSDDNAITLESLDLAALLCSRVCHDVISPVGRHRQRA